MSATAARSGCADAGAGSHRFHLRAGATALCRAQPSDAGEGEHSPARGDEPASFVEFGARVVHGHPFDWLGQLTVSSQSEDHVAVTRVMWITVRGEYDRDGGLRCSHRPLLKTALAHGAHRGLDRWLWLEELGFACHRAHRDVLCPPDCPAHDKGLQGRRAP